MYKNLITRVDFPLVQTREIKKSTEKEVGASKRKHTPITISQKIEVCIEKNKDPNIKNNQLTSKYNVSESTVSEILKKSDYFYH